MQLRQLNKNAKLIKKFLIVLSLLLILGIIPSTTFAQEPKNSDSDQQHVIENRRLKQLLADALNKLSNDEDKLKAANDLIVAQTDETAKAKNALTISQAESTALRRVIEADDMAIAAYKRAYEAEQTASDAYKHRAENAEGRVDKLQDQIAKARKHGMMGTVLGVLVGAFARGF